MHNKTSWHRNSLILQFYCVYIHVLSCASQTCIILCVQCTLLVILYNKGLWWRQYYLHLINFSSTCYTGRLLTAKPYVLYLMIRRKLSCSWSTSNRSLVWILTSYHSPRSIQPMPLSKCNSRSPCLPGVCYKQHLWC